jgi:CMP-N-acetylneuraminic acid synthetase
MSKDIANIAKAYDLIVENNTKCTCSCKECKENNCKKCSCKNCDCHKCNCDSAYNKRKDWLDKVMPTSK